MTVSKAEKRAYIWQLIQERERLYALLSLLDFDIDIRRQLETLRKLPHDAKRSIDVERTRAELQQDMEHLAAEINAALDVIAR
jgi:hypothetical protein